MFNLSGIHITNKSLRHLFFDFMCSVHVLCFQVQKVEFGLVICDEGHRLKNSSIKTSSALSSLSCNRRVILTGAHLRWDGI